MIRSFLFCSLFIFVVFVTSCSRTAYPVQQPYRAILEADTIVRKYNLKFDFHRTHLSTILAVRKVDSGEIRMIGASPFGLSLFDFGLREDSLHVYSCIEPLRKKKLLKLLEDDFNTIFLSDKRLKKVKQKRDYTEYINKGGLVRAVIRVSKQENEIEKVEVRHSWIRLFMNIEKMEDTHVTE